MSKIAVNEITDEQGSGRPSFTNGVQTSNINGGQVGGRRNLIINGDMRVAQRGTSATGVSTNGYHTVDRWIFEIKGGSLDIEQSSDAPENFSNSLRATVDSTYSPGASDQNYIGTRLESQNVHHLGYGTSSSKVSILSFWVKSNDTGNRVLWLFNNNNTQFRHYAQVFSVAQANTWEKFEFLIPTDTVSFDNDNSTGLEIRIILASGYTGGIPDSGWADITASRHAGIDNFFDTVGNEFYLTGVQLEVGDTATEFEHRSYGEELALCQRYFERVTHPFNTGRVNNGGGHRLLAKFLVPKRVEPTISSEGVFSISDMFSVDSVTDGSGFDRVQHVTNSGCIFQFDSSQINNPFSNQTVIHSLKPSSLSNISESQDGVLFADAEL